MFASSFESEERSFKNRKTSLAAFITIALHALILLFLIWSILTPPDPPYSDSAGGVTVNFGTDETGMGDVQPTTLTPIQADFAPPVATSASSPAAAKEDIATQDLEDAPVMEKTKTETPKPKAEKPSVTPTKNTNTNTSTKPKNENPAPPEPKADPNALFHKGAGGNPNNSKGDGTGNTPGDQGKTYGDPNSKSYLDGEGKGSGPGKGDLRGGVSLKNRKSAALPAPKFCNEKGNVIIDITVDRSGNVVEAKYHRDGSTITDNCSIENAKKAAKLSRFNADANADEYQYGSINYVFTVQ